MTALASSLVSHVYGVFPSHGYPGDPRYPASYSLAGVVLDNSDCRGHGALFCSPHSYLHTAPTKQVSRHKTSKYFYYIYGYFSREYTKKIFMYL